MFPASAGMNRLGANAGYYETDVPRKRGDEPPLLIEAGIPIKCSPQARG